MLNYERRELLGVLSMREGIYQPNVGSKYVNVTDRCKRVKCGAGLCYNTE